MIDNRLSKAYELSAGHSVARRDVYQDYVAFCEANCLCPTTAAIFGKMVRMVFPNISSRRLGKRRANVVHYYNFRKTPTNPTCTSPASDNSNATHNSDLTAISKSHDHQPSPPRDADPKTLISAPTDSSFPLSRQLHPLSSLSTHTAHMVPQSEGIKYETANMSSSSAHCNNKNNNNNKMISSSRASSPVADAPNTTTTTFINRALSPLLALDSAAGQRQLPLPQQCFAAISSPSPVCSPAILPCSVLAQQAALQQAVSYRSLPLLDAEMCKSLSIARLLFASHRRS